MYICQHFFVFSKNKAIYFEIIVAFENITVYFGKYSYKREAVEFKGELFHIFSNIINGLSRYAYCF